MSDFESFFWRGQERFRCNQKWENGTPCLFDTYDMETMIEHIACPHNRSGKVPKQPKRIPVASPILDTYGNPTIREMEVDPEYRDIKFKE